jgi:hypothetical protein
VLSLKASKKVDLSSYDCIIHGGSLYASGVLGLKSISRRAKKGAVVVFAVGATPFVKSLEESIAKKNDKNNTGFKLFYLRGDSTFQV